MFGGPSPSYSLQGVRVAPTASGASFAPLLRAMVYRRSSPRWAGLKKVAEDLAVNDGASEAGSTEASAGDAGDVSSLSDSSFSRTTSTFSHGDSMAEKPVLAAESLMPLRVSGELGNAPLRHRAVPPSLRSAWTARPAPSNLLERRRCLRQHNDGSKAKFAPPLTVDLWRIPTTRLGPVVAPNDIAKRQKDSSSFWQSVNACFVGVRMIVADLLADLQAEEEDATD